MSIPLSGGAAENEPEHNNIQLASSYNPAGLVSRETGVEWTLLPLTTPSLNLLAIRTCDDHIGHLYSLTYHFTL